MNEWYRDVGITRKFKEERTKKTKQKKTRWMERMI